MTNNFQNYKHYKLPITINPLEYGKLILNKDNIFIISITPRTILVITQYKDFNDIKFYRDGDLIFNYRDHKINENTFIRSLEDQKFTFENNKLISIYLDKSKVLGLMINIFIIFKYFVEDITQFIKLNYKAELFILFSVIFLYIIFPENSSDLLISITMGRHILTNESYNFENKIFTTQLFQTIYNKFFKSVENKFTGDNHIYILLKIKYKGNQTLSIGTVQRFNKIDKQ